MVQKPCSGPWCVVSDFPAGALMSSLWGMDSTWRIRQDSRSLSVARMRGVTWVCCGSRRAAGGWLAVAPLVEAGLRHLKGPTSDRAGHWIWPSGMRWTLLSAGPGCRPTSTPSTAGMPTPHCSPPAPPATASNSPARSVRTPPGKQGRRRLRHRRPPHGRDMHAAGWPSDTAASAGDPISCTGPATGGPTCSSTATVRPETSCERLVIGEAMRNDVMGPVTWNASSTSHPWPPGRMWHRP